MFFNTNKLKKKRNITVAGVPEHFNLPWHLAIESGAFQKKGIHLIWKDYHGGTGAMCKALQNKETDVALLLTEGAVKDIINSKHSKIVKIYVKSPLLWGIHVGKNSTINTISDLENAKIAISRFGSGSHLMAKINAFNNKFNPDNLEYEIIKNLDGGIAYISSNENAYFLWEHFTTKPFVLNNTVKRIATIQTPWSCFVMAVRNDVLLDNSKAIKTIIKIINKQIKEIEKNKFSTKTIKLFSERYNLRESDIKEWLSLTKWDSKKGISAKKQQKLLKKLAKFEVISKGKDTASVFLNL